MVVDVRIAGEQSEASWKNVVDSLVKRNVGCPRLAVIDGNAVLERALRAVWSKIDMQRCTKHKLWKLLSKAPVGLREELAEDAVLLLLFGVLRTGPVVPRRIVGWQDMPTVVSRKSEEESQAA